MQQNPYAIERFIQEHNAHARAMAELQALQRKAVAERRRVIWEGRWFGLGRLLRRPVGGRFARAGR